MDYFPDTIKSQIFMTEALCVFLQVEIRQVHASSVTDSYNFNDAVPTTQVVSN
jgi:hypothetical protein